MTGRRARTFLPALALVLAGSTVAAWAYWSAPGTGIAAVTSASLEAATISVPASAVTTITITWTQQASLQPTSPDNSTITYSVERRLGSGSWNAVSGGGCSGALPYGVTSCTDAPLAAGNYSFRVAATYQTWTATSAEAGPVSFTNDTTAPTVVAQVTPAPNAAGWNRTSPVEVSLSADDGGGSGVDAITYTTDGTDPTTSGTAQAYMGPLSIGATTTIKYFATDVAGNPSSVQTQLVKIDIAPPSNAVTLSSVTGAALKNGSTVYYRGSASGSFRLTNAVSDGFSGPASSETAALSGTSTGWMHSPSLVSTPAGGPYVSNSFSWSAPTTSSPSETVTGSDSAGNTAATTLGFVDDSVAPTGGTVDATGLTGTGGRYSTSTGLSVAFSPGTDAGSGLGTGTQLWRASAPLGNGSCGVYGSPAQLGANDPVSPVVDVVPAANTCYRYEYISVDKLGNSTTSTSPDVKVDTTAPAAPTFAFSALTNTYWSGSTLFFRSNAASGAFTVTASATDAASGIVSYGFPILPAGWTATPGALGVDTYSWSPANPTAPSGAQNITATNNAALTSPAAGFTLTSDVTAPATGTVAYTSGYYTSLSVNVTFTGSTDGGSGVIATSGLVQRADATLTANTCGSYGGFATVAAGGTNPTSPFADTSVTSGNCYQYRYLIFDNVGNQATYTSASVAKVDSTPPSITRAIAAKTSGVNPGTIRQGGDYYVYAEITDSHSGVSTATANTSSFDTGVTAASLSATGGPWTVGGLSYAYRSAVLTANTGLTTGTTPSYTISTADAAGHAVGPTSYAVTIETYNTVVTGTSGLVSYWRFGDGAVAGDDAFADTAGTLLSSHIGTSGMTWGLVSGMARTAVISAGGRLRKETGNGGSQYYASAIPTNANYLVQSDVFVASLLATDSIAVVGRQDISGTGQTYYRAQYIRPANRWELSRVVSGTATLIGTGSGTGFYTQTLVAASTYRLTLKLDGTSIVLMVDGVSRIVATDAVITAAGRAGVSAGTAASTAQVSDAAGLHLDNFRVTNITPTAADSYGVNHGTYTNGPLLSEPGALAGDTNRAVRLDGTNDYVTVPDALSLRFGNGPLTIETWIKRSTVDLNALLIVQKGASGAQFALYNDNAQFGKNDVGTIVTSTASVTGTGWHHLVVTKNGAATLLYIDGVDRTGGVTERALTDVSPAPLRFGAYDGVSNYLPASIDEFAVYNAALSAATVLDHYKAGIGTG